MSTERERDAARRREILDAAMTCFLKFGYRKTSLDDIAKTAKLSRPLLYRKFANKEAIFAALYDGVFVAQYRTARAIALGTGTRRARLARVCELVYVAPYELIARSPMAGEFLAACEELLPDSLADHQRKRRALLGKLVPARLAELLDLAVEGFYSDEPTVATLRARIGLLIERLA